jgi:hypothetical protein
MPHHRLWTAWLRSTSGLLPVEIFEFMGSPVGSKAQVDNIIHGYGTDLFSIYVHPCPGYTGYPKASIFFEKEIPEQDRVKVNHYAVSYTIHHCLFMS